VHHRAEADRDAVGGADGAEHADRRDHGGRPNDGILSSSGLNVGDSARSSAYDEPDERHRGQRQRQRTDDRRAAPAALAALDDAPQQRGESDGDGDLAGPVPCAALGRLGVGDEQPGQDADDQAQGDRRHERPAEVGDRGEDTDAREGLADPEHGDVLGGGVQEFAEGEDESAEDQEPFTSEEIAERIEIELEMAVGKVKAEVTQATWEPEAPKAARISPLMGEGTVMHSCAAATARQQAMSMPLSSLLRAFVIPYSPSRGNSGAALCQFDELSLGVGDPGHSDAWLR
jgi:hypothetical protein